MKAFCNTRIALSQLSVWILAVAIIPPLCNAMIAPIMKKFSPKTDNIDEKKPVLQEPPMLNPVVQPYNTVIKRDEAITSFRNRYINYSTGMRV